MCVWVRAIAKKMLLSRQMKCSYSFSPPPPPQHSASCWQCFEDWPKHTGSFLCWQRPGWIWKGGSLSSCYVIVQTWTARAVWQILYFRFYVFDSGKELSWVMMDASTACLYVPNMFWRSFQPRPKKLLSEVVLQLLLNTAKHWRCVLWIRPACCRDRRRHESRVHWSKTWDVPIL